jgi:RHS repeat-associated protein
MATAAQVSVRQEYPSPSYYRARYYDPNAGRFLSEDPLELAGGINFYLYVGNEPIDRDDPTGLYQTGSQVPLPINPSLDKLLKCMDNCTGANLFVTATSNGKHQDPGHTAGTSVDILPPPGVPGNSVFCCAGKCGAAWGIDEGPGGIKTKFTTGFNYHLQLVPPRHPRPGAPNAIPPGCTPSGCQAADGVIRGFREALLRTFIQM